MSYLKTKVLIQLTIKYTTDENYDVKDHCKYRGSAHDICTVKCNIP